MLKIYNSLTRKIDEFKPLKNNEVGIYVCGPTVYGPTHLGHARTWIFFDWLRRYFLFQNYQVKFVQNITDAGHLIDDAEEGMDKIEQEAKLQGKTPAEIAQFYEAQYFHDLAALNILKPDFSPRATEYIKDIIAFIEVLIQKGHAYEAQGNVYFDVSSFSEYGQLSGRKSDFALQETRVKKDPLKKNQADFALWLKAKENHLQKWPSPWGLSRAGSRGEGFPGWHIECSVMSEKILGQPFDIHGSASEHIFPHHENEIAQSVAFAHKPLADYFLHAGMLLIDGHKMAKSLKNYLTVEDVLRENEADTIRLAFMQTQWRKPYDWPVHRSLGEGGSKNATLEAGKLKGKLVRAKLEAKVGESRYEKEIVEAIEDDFNLPKVITLIVNNLNQLTQGDFELIEKIFGLKLEVDKLS